MLYLAILDAFCVRYLFLALWFGLHAFVAAQAYKALGSSPFKRNAFEETNRDKEKVIYVEGL